MLKVLMMNTFQMNNFTKNPFLWNDAFKILLVRFETNSTKLS